MLESLNSIDVQELKDTQREANQVRALINEMIADIAQIRDERIDTLHYAIWHQSTVNQCTASAVQFLIERLQSELVQDKDELLLLLAYVARGNSYANTEQQDTTEHEILSTEELTWRQNAYNAVARGIPAYLDLLEHEEPIVRTSAAYTLACFKEQACHIIPRLQACIDKEEDALAKSSMLLCLGALGEASINQQLLTEVTQEQANPLVKLTAAMALARLAQDNTPPEAIHVLVDTIIEPALTNGLYNELPWAETDVVGDTCSSLYALGPGPTHIAIPLLLEALETTHTHSSLRVVDALLHVAFNGAQVHSGLMAQTLNDEQRLILHAIAKSDCAWLIDILNVGKTS